MGLDSSSSSLSSASIPVVFITMSDYDTIKQLMNESSASSASIAVKLFSRPDPYEYLPTVVLFFIAVSIIAFGANAIGKQEIAQPTLTVSYKYNSPNQPANGEGDESTRHRQHQQEPVEIKAWHAVLFILHCAVLLTLLYFFDLNHFVTFIYVIFASIAIAVVFVYPIIHKLHRTFDDSYNSEVSVSQRRLPPVASEEYFSQVANTPLFAVALACSLGIMIVWAFNR